MWIFIDTFTGINASKHRGDYKSRICRVKCITKVASYLLFLFTALSIDILAKSAYAFLLIHHIPIGGWILSTLFCGYILTALTLIFILGTELSSVIENCKELGIDFPTFIKLLVKFIVMLPLCILKCAISKISEIGEEKDEDGDSKTS